MSSDLSTDSVGKMFEVTGTRGKAKQHRGFVGRCVWISGRAQNKTAPQQIKLDDGLGTLTVASSQVTKVT